MRPLRPLESRTAAPGPPEPSVGARTTARRRAGLKRRSVAVRVLRVLAPLCMAVIAAVMVGWIVGRAHKRERAPAANAPVNIHMSNPRFLGRDGRARPFVLTGSDAVRDDRDAHLVHLTQPHLTLETEPGRQFVVIARTGAYRDDSRKLTLMGDVVVDDGKGNRFYSDAGDIDTDTGDVTGRSNARGEGPTGTIAGDSYALSDHGDHATFTGRVKSRLYNGTPPAAAPQVGAPPAQKRP